MHHVSIARSSVIHDAAESHWWVLADCPNCGRVQALIVAAEADNIGSNRATVPSGAQTLLYLRCATCREGIVVNHGVVSPRSRPMRDLGGLPGDVQAVWREVRAVLSVSGWTAGVMLCRKIVLHVAVSHELPAKNERGRGPTFEDAVSHLTTVGLITPLMKPWVDHIRTVGNGANHELDPVGEQDALRVATFTEQLLVLAYEMPATMTEALPPAATEPPNVA